LIVDVAAGLLRLKRRRDRRPRFKPENPFVFYPRFWSETVHKMLGLARDWWTYSALGQAHLRGREEDRM